jgi:hypothetical protein
MDGWMDVDVGGWGDGVVGEAAGVVLPCNVGIAAFFRRGTSEKFLGLKGSITGVGFGNWLMEIRKESSKAESSRRIYTFSMEAARERQRER